jgi:hypothetical protein
VSVDVLRASFMGPSRVLLDALSLATSPIPFSDPSVGHSIVLSPVNLDAEGDYHRDKLEPEDEFDDDNQEI